MKKSKRTSMMTIEGFRRRFGDEERCWEHLMRLRWPQGFVCRRCGGGSRGYMKARRLHECRACGYQASVTAGTIFHKARVPLRDWFWAIYRLSQGKKGVSALQLSKEIGVTYPTAWLMAHKIRQAMADREQGRKLRGLVEVDEGYVGGKERGWERGGRSTQHKSIVAVGVEHWKQGEPGRPPIPGRAVLAVLPDVTTSSLRAFLGSRVKTGSTLWSDRLSSYGGLSWRGFPHAAIPLRHDPDLTQRFLPWVHIVLSNLKRFLLGTHHKPEAKHLSRYVAEFTYRFNRRWQERTLFHRLTRACLSANTITYKDLVAEPDQT
ncbi:MAG TPA: IS1595 family transposase [Candidatus Acidoferrales bacterium]|nr:IS1595 family transposase [Candidatus Acidoferrales bacterium]